MLFDADEVVMALRLFLLFTVVPALELWLLIQVGSIIGVFETIFLIILTGAIGANLARNQGLQVLGDRRRTQATNDCQTWNWNACFFLQPIVEGLLNCRRRVSDSPNRILISRTPARKSTDVIVFLLSHRHLRRNLRRNPILRTQTFVT